MSENKVTTPFKTMDIKSAFLAVANRKRKASSPTAIKAQSKSLKLNNDENEDGLQIISEENDAVQTGDCKENKDLNSLLVKDNQMSDIETLNPDDKNPLNSELNKTVSLSSDGEDEVEATSDEMNSTLNDSALRTSELSESVEIRDKSEVDLNSSVDSKGASAESKPKRSKVENQNDERPKKKRKMTADEAVARASEREEKQKLRLLKKQELEAQKLEKQKLKERRQIEKEQRQMEKEKEKLEKEEERKERERLKQEKKDQEEKERLHKLKEKEDRKKQQQMILEMKQEEKKKKEEQRLKREEDMKKAEEEKQKAKLEKEQKEKEKKEKAKAAFMKFFKKDNVTAAPVPIKPIEKEGVFKPFQISDNMVLAHIVQPAAQERFNKTQLDQALKSQAAKELYLQVLKSGCYKDVRLRKKLRKQRTCDSDVIIIDNSAQADLFFTAKLLQFTENVRPPYWGTWRKQSTKIGPRNPFAQDDIFDYSVDSDDEWDEGGPGESLSGTENEQESEDDYEVDNEFFVPHGYLSAEEEKEEDEEVTNDPEKQKAVLKLKQQEFESERKKKTTELKPICLGCYFENASETKDKGLQSFLMAYSAEILSDTPILTRFTVKKVQMDPTSNVNSPSTGTPASNKKLKLVPEEAMPHLIRLLHGNINNKDAIIKEFQAFWQQHSQATSQPKDSAAKAEPVETNPSNQEALPENSVQDSTIISKRQLFITIKKISTYGKCSNPAQKRCVWMVHEEVREKYGLVNLPIPSEWIYITSKEELETSPVVKKDTASPVVKKDTASPVVKKDTASPVVKKDTASPVVKKDTASPVVKKDTASPVVKKDTASLIVKKNTALPVVKKDTASPVVKKDTASPVEKKDTALSVVKNNKFSIKEFLKP